MRALRLIALALLIMVAGVVEAVAQRYSVTGRVVSTDAEAVAYATVVITQDNSQVAGGATDSNGEFTLKAPEGDYTLNISYIGYKKHTYELSLKGDIALGDITLETDATQIDAVVITSDIIRREADRFVVDVANSPIALGKDGEELLKSAPGVWIQDNKISINGASGSKIYLNDREVKLDDTQLLAYIRSLRAEDIQRIEVIPQSGADYDAASAGGIIKITTKRNLNSGLMGSVSLVGNGSANLYNIMPSLSLNYNSGGLNLYGRTWAGTNGYEYTTEEHTDYDSGTVIDAATTMKEKSTWAGINLGFVYDINSRHSIGAELQHNYWGGSDNTDTWTEHSLSSRRSEGDYSSKMNSNMTTATLNYIIKLDEIGSNIKFIGDYTNSMTPHNYNYFDTSYDMLTQMNKIDSTYRNAAGGRYQLATARVDYTKIFSDKLNLKAGVKYTYNKNGNTSKYEWLTDGNWIVNEEQGYDIGYTENIAAAYVTASARVGRWSFVGGLRGEYTHFHERGTEEPLSSYFKLFPNANISYSITPKGDYSLVVQYSRNITRPSFWALSPNETKISEYMIQRGNPKLKPSLSNNLSLTAVFKYKYTLTVGMTIMKNGIQQATIVDANNPELLILQTINYPTLNNYFAQASLPFQIKKWWSMNINLNAMYLGQRIYPDEPVRRNFMTYANAQMSFTLPKNFFIEVDGHFMHGAVAGNTRVADSGNMNITLKKRMLDNKLTIALGATNIINTAQRITINEPTFTRTMVARQPWGTFAAKLSISYNFNAGKQFRAKAVESGSAEDLGRIGSSGN
jgi:hypothetical protein